MDGTVSARNEVLPSSDLSPTRNNKIRNNTTVSNGNSVVHERFKRGWEQEKEVTLAAEK